MHAAMERLNGREIMYCLLLCSAHLCRSIHVYLSESNAYKNCLHICLLVTDPLGISEWQMDYFRAGREVHLLDVSDSKWTHSDSVFFIFPVGSVLEENTV